MILSSMNCGAYFDTPRKSIEFAPSTRVDFLHDDVSHALQVCERSGREEGCRGGNGMWLHPPGSGVLSNMAAQAPIPKKEWGSEELGVSTCVFYKESPHKRKRSCPEPAQLGVDMGLILVVLYHVFSSMVPPHAGLSEVCDR